MPRSMADPNYRYQPWSDERRKRASDAAKVRLAASAKVEVDGDYRGPVNNIEDFKRCSTERRNQLMGAIATLLAHYKGVKMDDDTADFAGKLLALYIAQAHVVAREFAIMLEGRAKDAQP